MLMPYKYQANTPVLSAAMMLETMPGLAAETQEGNGITDGLVGGRPKLRLPQV